MKLGIAFLALWIPVVACNADRGNKQCADFLSRIKPEETYSIDLAKLADYPKESPIHAALLKKKIESSCKPLKPDPDSFVVAYGATEQPWVIFVSKAVKHHQDETLEGSSADLVFYGGDGIPLRQSNVASLLTHEGFGLSRTARISRAEIEICDQEVEFFEYSDSGDITGLLDTPVRSTCKISRAAP